MLPKEILALYRATDLVIPAPEWREWRNQPQYAEALKEIRRREMRFRYGEVGQDLTPAERLAFADGLSDAVRLIENLGSKVTAANPSREPHEEE
jgi:hypothetical protein